MIIIIDIKVRACSHLEASSQSEIVGMTDWWSFGKVYLDTDAVLSTWMEAGLEWEYQVQTIGNSDDVSDWTSSVFVTAAIETAPGPSNIKTAPSGDGIQFNWNTVSGYDTIVWDQDTDGAFIQEDAASGTEAFIGGLISGHGSYHHFSKVGIHG
jgi:hypothetical protein